MDGYVSIERMMTYLFFQIACLVFISFLSPAILKFSTGDRCENVRKLFWMISHLFGGVKRVLKFAFLALNFLIKCTRFGL